eukprot:TRINITY_DN2543_c1_g2_i1.p1 TRINITY_DN2543_c1_g2~~TRINITY_DN2543_c1_g2_i1.p1  ORF type:complete len:373 (+),score=45.51 TRINITY_DN2543_c1_g2_i1:38-1156(+)
MAKDSKQTIDSYILRKYDIVRKVGQGAYGIVWKAIDKRSGRHVALKKIFDAFQNDTDAQRTFREIMFLQELSDHDNIIRLLNVLKAENDQDIYLVFDYLETDLHAVIRANILEPIHKQYVIYQILKSLKYLHSGGLIHRDLKPANVLLNAQCKVKLGDFGLARSLNSTMHGQPPVMTDYIATRWYRAPEILVGSQSYSGAVDMWAVGCILAEALSGSPLFPGRSTMNQLQRVVEVVGTPTAEDVNSLRSQFAHRMISNLPPLKHKSLDQIFPHAPTDALDLMKKMLIFNPSKRITAEEALKHPFVSDFASPEEETTCPKKITISIDDNVKMSIDHYRTTLYNEVIKKKRELRRIRHNRNSRTSDSTRRRRFT